MKDLKKYLGTLVAVWLVLLLAVVPVFADDMDEDDGDDAGITTVPPQDDDAAYDEAFENEPRTPATDPARTGDPLLTILQEQVAGTWQKAREAGNRAGALVTRVRIDVLGKRFLVTRGTRTWTYEIVQFTGDTTVDMPRFTLTVSGQGRRHQFTILAFSSNTLYLGQSPVPGLQFWGTYQRAVEGR
jgi:hypothetical protein